MIPKRRSARRWITVLGMLLLISLAAQGAPGAEDGKGEIPEGWQLLPRVGVGVEYGGYVVHQDNYTSMLRRRLEIDVIQYRRHIFYLDFDEEDFFGIPRNKWQFNLMKYNLTLGGYRYDFGDYYVGAFFQHQCNNPVLTESYDIAVDRERANIYLVGLEFLTKTMRLGMKDRGINFESAQAFEFLGRLAGAASVSKAVVRENIKLSWLLKGQVRYDIFRYRRLVPYVEVAGKLLGGPVTRLVPSVEVGTRYHLSKVDITPFFKWLRDQEPFALPGYFHPAPKWLVTKNSLYGGARLEVLLDADTFAPSSGGQGLQLFPEIHGTADYALIFPKKQFNAHGNIELDFEVLRLPPWTIFLYTDMNFNSAKENFKPDKVVYWLQYGLTYALCDRYFLEGFVKHSRRVDDVTFRGTMEGANLAGLRLGTKGMKPGHYNDGISFEGPNTFQWLHNWNAQGSVGHYFQNRDWQYLWDLAAQVRYDPLRWHFLVPYVQGEVNWRSGGGRTPDTVEYAGETGIRAHGVLDLSLYYRFQHCENVLFFGGPAANQNLIGIKGQF